jgi:hypothetical protein
MMTGDNPGLAARLLMYQFDRIGRGGPKTWIDAGYCLDAPNTLAAGSTVRDEFGPGDDDWIEMSSYVDRESPNDQAKGPRGCSRGPA